MLWDIIGFLVKPTNGHRSQGGYLEEAQALNHEPLLCWNPIPIISTYDGSRCV